MPLDIVSMAIYVTLEGKIPRTPTRHRKTFNRGFVLKNAFVKRDRATLHQAAKKLCQTLLIS